MATSIADKLKSGTKADQITVLARRHHELVALLPYFAEAGVAVNYERRENVLDNEVVCQLELLAQIVHYIAIQRLTDAETLLPELLAHEAWDVSGEQLWKLSLSANRERTSWLEYMSKTPHFEPIHAWLVDAAAKSLVTPLEPMLDYLLGVPTDTDDNTEPAFRSPLYEYHFSSEKLSTDPEQYIELLTALSTIRDKLREHSQKASHKLADFLEYLDLQRELGTSITRVIGRNNHDSSRINLMTAHKSKGMEFDHVYIIGAVDSAWGQTVRSRNRLISYPENLHIAPAGDSSDERLRLFFVAMTRAKSSLTISYSTHSETDASLSPASFLVGDMWQQELTEQTDHELTVEEAKLAWYQPVVDVAPPTARDLLASRLERYALSATHLNTFLDVTRGGPTAFLMNNLLRFPQAMSANAAYGSAIHRTLQQAHTHFAATDHRRPIEDILSDFELNLSRAQLTEAEHEQFLKRGVDNLAIFFAQRYESFSGDQRAELDFAHQSSMLGVAKLTGSLDMVLLDPKAKTLRITDYKTGKPSSSWKGKSDPERIKLHKYRQQLLFYKLMVENSREFSGYKVESACLEFVEPSPSGEIITLDIEFDQAELDHLEELIAAVWRCIVEFDLPDTSAYGDKYKDLVAFEDYLLGL